MSLFGIGRLITPNATIEVQSYTVTQDDAGATVETYATITGGSIQVLFTLFSAQRGGDFGTDSQQHKGTISGVSSLLMREDTRFKITAFKAYPGLVGTYWRVESTTFHPSGRGGILDSRVTCSVSQVKLPGKVS